MSKILNFFFVAIVIASCSKDICSYTRPELRTNKNENISGNLNGKLFTSLWKPRMEYNSDTKKYGIGFQTNETECSEFATYGLGAYFNDLKIGSNKIDSAISNSIILTLPDVTSFCCADSFDTKYDNKIVITEIKNDSIISGTLQVRLFLRKRSQRPNTTDDQNALEFKDCKFSVIVKR